MKRANVRGTTLEYEVLGSGEPVLLIHGVLVADGLRPLVEEDSLAGRYKLIVYHRRESPAATAPRRRTRSKIKQPTRGRFSRSLALSARM